MYSIGMRSLFKDNRSSSLLLITRRFVGNQIAKHPSQRKGSPWDMDSKIKTTVEIQVASSLRKLVGGASIVRAHGETVGQLVDNLDKQFPGLKEYTINKLGKLRGSILICLNEEDIRCLQELETPLKNGDAVAILVVLAGG